MGKFVVGERYKVDDSVHLEGGNIIEITEVDPVRCRYKTVEGKAPEHWAEFFCKNSTFAKNLTLFAGEEKVVVLRNGNTVTATQYMDGEKRGTGVAKCSPGDAFDFAFGAKLALERLFTESNGVAKSRFDWGTFGDGKISVQVNRETINDFLQYCEEEGFFWKSGKQATKMNLFAVYDGSPSAQMLLRFNNCEPKENIWISVDEGKLCFETDVPESEIFVWAKLFDWKAFKSGKIAVKLTEESEKKFPGSGRK
nr:MAG TPA: hypothetical protein [Caudoviricetes sp.]